MTLNKTPKLVQLAIRVLLPAAFATTLTGCGELSTGANAIPSVKYRPDTSAQPAAPAETETASTEATPSEGGVGSLKGKVVFDGTFAALPPLFGKGTATKDPAVCAGTEDIPNETILVKDGGLANVFVFLEKAPKGATIPAADPSAVVMFDQKNCIFLPHAIALRTKVTVKVLNDDAAAHNTHTNPVKNTAFNQIVSPNDRSGASFQYNLAEREPFKVTCDIHPWMQAYHLPLDHPFAAVSAADGTFEIKDLPAGKHEFRVWHEAGKMINKALAVTIKPGDNEVTIKVSPSQLGK
jgi:hypothetical protein